MLKIPGRSSGRAPLTYAAAGVDLAAGEEAVDRIKAHVRSTFRPEVIGDLGGFGGLFAFDHSKYRDPVLVSSTDGVGTKSQIARLTRRYETIGRDLVAMSVDDVAVQGAEPLFFLDYISVGSLDVSMIDDLVAGVAAGCREAQCALIGGEMAEHPEILDVGDFDFVGFAVGVAERSKLLPRGVRSGDRLLGIASPGLRSNGYSLARAALLGRAGRSLDDPAWTGAHHSLGEELLVPSVIYAPSMLELCREVEVHAFAHITGGGIPGNLERVLPEHCDAVLVGSVWDVPRIFDEIQVAGEISDNEMGRVFNMGLGMIAVVPARSMPHALDVIRAAGHDAWDVGEIRDGKRQVTITARA